MPGSCVAKFNTMPFLFCDFNDVCNYASRSTFLFTFLHLMFFLHEFNFSLASNSNFLIRISFLPDVVDLWYFTLSKELSLCHNLWFSNPYNLFNPMSLIFDISKHEFCIWIGKFEFVTITHFIFLKWNKIVKVWKFKVYQVVKI